MQLRFVAYVPVLSILLQPPGFVFEIDLWPGEGRPNFQAVTTELVTRQSPSMSARIIRRTRVSIGQPLEFDQTRYRTIQSGLLNAVSSSSVTGRALGNIRRLTRDAYYTSAFPWREIACNTGDVIEYLQYRAEGSCFVRVGDQVVDADPCPALNDRNFRVITQPKTEWWIRVVDGGSAGWLLVDDKTVKVARRSF